MLVENTINSADIELSDEDLDAVAGGTATLVEATSYRAKLTVFSLKTSSGPGGSTSVLNVASLFIDTGAFKAISLS